MALRGGQPGNTNAAKGRPWAAAIERALKKRTLATQKEALDELAEKFLTAVENGDISAYKELGDRIDGKPQQSIDATVDANLIVEVVRFADTDPQ